MKMFTVRAGEALRKPSVDLIGAVTQPVEWAMRQSFASKWMLMAM